MFLETQEQQQEKDAILAMKKQTKLQKKRTEM